MQCNHVIGLPSAAFKRAKHLRSVFEEIKTFIQKGCVKLSVQTFTLLQKKSVLNKCF